MQSLKRVCLLLPAIATVTLGLSGTCAAAHERAPELLHLAPCHVPGVAEQLQCGTYDVFENRAAQNGRKIVLYVIVFKATGPHPASDPVFYLSGGPGEAASDNASFFALPEWKPIRRDRDIVLVDQRGTGKSNPLTCMIGDINQAFQALYAVKISDVALRKCLTALKTHADLRFYTTPFGMDDLDDVRAALGYDKIDLYGGSYGTRSALVYMRRHPGHVRSALLRAIAPVDMKALLTSARLAQIAFDGLVRDCTADSVCVAAYPRIRADLAAVLARLAKAPAQVPAHLPGATVPVTVEITRDIFAGALTWIMSAPEGAAAVPLLLKAAAAGDYGPFVSASVPLAAVAGSAWGMGMALSVICTEDAALIDQHAIAAATSGTFMGAGRVRNELRLCRHWPRGILPEDYARPVHSGLPVLMISGAYDPIDGLDLARGVARDLTNSLHVVVASGAHHPQFPGCAMDIATRFIAQGSAKGLDASCIRTVHRPAWAGISLTH